MNDWSFSGGLIVVVAVPVVGIALGRLVRRLSSPAHRAQLDAESRAHDAGVIIGQPGSSGVTLRGGGAGTPPVGEDDFYG